MAGAVQILIPQPDVWVNNATFPQAAKSDLQQVVVETTLDMPSMFTLQLVSRNLLPGETPWIDRNLFDIGTTIEIKMDERDRDPLIYGEITGLEPEFHQDEVPTLLVRGYDLRHRLMRGQNTRTFVQTRDSEIVRDIARENGLSVDGQSFVDTKIKLDYVFQHNQSDLNFLQERASRIGYELGMKRNRLTFQPLKLKQDPIETLNFPKALTRFSPRLSSLNQAKEVIFQGWDVQKKQPILERRKIDAQSKPMGEYLGAREVQASQVQVKQPVVNRAEASQMALGQFQSMALSYITGDGECSGSPVLQAGRIIEIQGVGKRFSGPYYLTSTTHTFGPNQRYRTEFSVKRNAHN